MSESPCNIMKCDSLARKYLPGIRAEMVYRLVNDKGMSQSDAAKRLGVTRAAISQYMSKKRGADIKLCGDIDSLIDRWALAVAGEDDHITLCDVCKCAMKK
ncbi:MAG: helix-turn-helix domain-containing protein [Methanomicrobiales archaeon]|nr:helix-turn-helix domain-containing protein [Methanomicrobiales archaeon]